jgi:hypothetical protein
MALTQGAGYSLGAEDYYERLIAALKIENENERVARANELGFEVTREKIKLTDAQGSSLWKLAVERIRSGDAFGFGLLSHIVSIGWQNKPALDVATTQASGSLSKRFNIPGAEAKLLQEADVFRQDESVSYWDRAHMYIGSKDVDRVGSLFLTDKRIVVVGELLSAGWQGETAYRLDYEDWKRQPFLDALDYIYLSQVRLISVEGDWHSHGIELTVVTKHYKETIQRLSRPDFFKTEVPSSLTAIEGTIKILLAARKLSGAEDLKTRHKVLLQRLKQHYGLK